MSHPASASPPPPADSAPEPLARGAYAAWVDASGHSGPVAAAGSAGAHNTRPDSLGRSPLPGQLGMFGSGIANVGRHGSTSRMIGGSSVEIAGS